MTAGSGQIAKVPLFGIGISVTDYAGACAAIMDAARAKRSYAVSALATHGLTEAARDAELGGLVNSIELVTPDGQPVRWAMNMLHGTALSERVYGPDLVAAVCAAAATERMSVYLFGSTAETCRAVAEELPRRYPGLRIVGVQPDRFREATAGRGRRGRTPDPRLWGRHRPGGSRLPAAGAMGRAAPRARPRADACRWRGVRLHRRQPRPAANMDAASGLEWLFRLIQEPSRLFRRYLVHNSLFCLMLAREVLQRKTTPSRG